MSMLSQATARALVDRLSDPVPAPRTVLWTGHGKYTRTGHRGPLTACYWHGRELRCYETFRIWEGFHAADFTDLGAPDHICTGSVAYSHTSNDGQPIAFASEARP
jgi:hypothetical protein